MSRSSPKQQGSLFTGGTETHPGGTPNGRDSWGDVTGRAFGKDPGAKGGFRVSIPKTLSLAYRKIVDTFLSVTVKGRRPDHSLKED